jgi:hypothetical protein
MGARTIAVTLALLCGVSVPAMAGPAITSFTPEPITANSTDTYGFSFALTNSETVEGLGAYNGGNAGLTGTAQVGLWDADGNLLASTTVPAGNAATIIGDFSYNGITPITLDALTMYYIGSYQPSDPVTSFQSANYSSPPLDSNVIFVDQAYGVGPGVVFPGQQPNPNNSTAGADLGANFTDGDVPIYSGLPEPTTLAILGTSLAGFVASRRRRARK